MTKSFEFYVYKLNTNNAFFEKKNINGVSIGEGQFQQCEVRLINNSTVMSMGKMVWIKLIFKSQNPLQEGSLIDIKFPNSIKIFTTP